MQRVIRGTRGTVRFVAKIRGRGRRGGRRLRAHEPTRTVRPKSASRRGTRRRGRATGVPTAPPRERSAPASTARGRVPSEPRGHGRRATRGGSVREHGARLSRGLRRRAPERREPSAVPTCLSTGLYSSTHLLKLHIRCMRDDVMFMTEGRKKSWIMCARE